MKKIEFRFDAVVDGQKIHNNILEQFESNLRQHYDGIQELSFKESHHIRKYNITVIGYIEDYYIDNVAYMLLNIDALSKGTGLIYPCISEIRITDFGKDYTTERLESLEDNSNILEVEDIQTKHDYIATECPYCGMELDSSDRIFIKDFGECPFCETSIGITRSFQNA